MKAKFKKLTLGTSFGRSVTLTVEILGECIDGYNLPSGAWSMFEGPGSTPAVFLKYREKGFRRGKRVPKEYVLNVESA